MLGQVMDRVADAFGRMAVIAVIGIIIALVWISSGRAQTYLPLPSTPDISITGTATAEYIFDLVFGRADHIAIKNDCQFPIWFALRPGRNPDAIQFNLLLNSGEAWSGPFRSFSIAASGDGANNCTFTLQLGKKVR
ncbi:hypothetical protein LCGC14_1963850 [marine sediment metagenome]|uniref:Uncharacterized protein n=1 Tax=marine sediment metagenome TaxID=412755 RepID=A0A0F9FDP2_9ZZZZ